MRAAEVELEAVAAGVLHPLDHLVPALLIALDHQRDHQRVVGELLFDLADLGQIVLEGAVGDQLDIVEAHDLAPVIVDRAVARGDIDDGLEVERLPHRATPARLERPPHLGAAVGGWRARQPERVRRADAADVGGEVRSSLRHVLTPPLARRGSPRCRGRRSCPPRPR
jgi:hypothetical protein